LSRRLTLRLIALVGLVSGIVAVDASAAPCPTGDSYTKDISIPEAGCHPHCQVLGGRNIHEHNAGDYIRIRNELPDDLTLINLKVECRGAGCPFDPFTVGMEGLSSAYILEGWSRSEQVVVRVTGDFARKRSCMNWTVTSEYPYRVYLKFYSVATQNRAWPGDGTAYELSDSAAHTYRLNCNSGEKVCYGAWVKGDAHYWGVGRDNGYSCTNCFGICEQDNPEKTLGP
jgi:hypothetical protein